MTLPIRAFVVRGPFNHEDFARLVETLREIDDDHPGNTYELVAVDATESALSLADKVLREVVPPKPDRVTGFWTIPTEDAARGLGVPLTAPPDGILPPAYSLAARDALLAQLEALKSEAELIEKELVKLMDCKSPADRRGSPSHQ